MVAHALPRQVALYIETTFATGGPADWSVDGTYFYVREIDTSGLIQATVENENNVARPRAKHPNIRTLKNSGMSFGVYTHGKATNAAEGAAATTFHIAELLHAAIGGRDLGFAAAVVSDAGEASSEIQIDADPGFEQGDWVFAFDTSAGEGQFYRIASIAAGPPITLTLDRALHFVPDPGGADTIHAVIDCYIHQAATTQHDHAGHKTMQFLAQGDAPEDVYVARGCKPAVSIDPISAGTPTGLSFDVMVTTFDFETAVKEDFGAAIPDGEAGIVAGVATTTYVKLATVGAELATVAARGAVTAEPGVAYDIVAGPNGHEGVHGYVDNLGDSTLEIIVPHDSSYNAEFRAGTTKHALVQVGHDSKAWGLYYPRLEYGTEPARTDEGALTGSALSFRALENQASPGALAGDSLEKWRSPMHILFVA